MISERSESRARGRRRSIVRTVTVGGKFTEAEASVLAKRAANKDQLLGEWAREALLAAGRGQQREADDMALFVEVQALRLLLINTLESFFRGDKLSTEQFKELLQYVKANKRKAAKDMLASYAEEATEEP